jgi:hypothetical protein
VEDVGAGNETQCLADGGAGADLDLTDGVETVGVFGVANLELAAWELSLSHPAPMGQWARGQQWTRGQRTRGQRNRGQMTMGQWTVVVDGRIIRSVGRRSHTAENQFAPAA